jgi:hypothetical protein
MFFGKELLKGGEVWKLALVDLSWRETIRIGAAGFNGAGVGHYAIAGF